ncbi:cyanothece NifK (plasmid) [Sinorhizobium americanum]|uniref:Cyanothece NifK n=2 Tax=Sinorhizobium americanum TaxID=194963 RepID=A0A1L3LTD5_9HYPH|nr:cyanothece NifK [Sinorhizobium americanum]
MELHDLAEDLPVDWTEIKAIAEKTFAAFAELDSAKRDLAALENSR